MAASDCAVGLLVDLSEPSPKVIKPKQKKTQTKIRKKSTGISEGSTTPTDSETKENINPTPVEGVRRNSITLIEAADVSERVLVDVTEKTSQSNGQWPWTLSDRDVTSLDNELFDFDLSGSPAIPMSNSEAAHDDEVFFGPVKFSEKCTVAALKTEAEMKPMSPLSSSQMAEIVREAHTVANSIASLISNSSSESDQSHNNSYSSPIARWKATKRPTDKETTSKTQKQGNISTNSTENSSVELGKKSPKGTPVTSPKTKMKEDEAEGSIRRSSTRIRRSSTFTIKDKEKRSSTGNPNQSLQFKDNKESTEHPTGESEPREVTTTSTHTNQLSTTGKTQMNENNTNKVQSDKGKKPSRLRKSMGIPKPSGLKPPSSRMPVAANRSLTKSSSSESLSSSCPGVRSLCDSIGSEGTVDNISIGSDISDISTASTASNISTCSKTSKLPTGRISGAGLPRIGAKINGTGLKRMSYGGKTNLNNTLNKNTGPMKANQPVPGLNRSLQTATSKLNYSGSYGKDRANSEAGATPRPRMSLGPSPGGLLKGRTPTLGTVPEPGHHPTLGLSSAKKPVPKRLNNGPLTKPSLIRPTDLHRKTLAANRSKQAPAVNGPLKATGQVPNKGKISPRPHPAVKRTVESVTTPVKLNKSVQPKKLSLSTSFDSPSKSTGSTSHVAASTPRSTSKSANRRSFLPTPTKSSHLVSTGSIPASPLSFRGVSASSVGSCGSSIRCDSDSVFDSSEQKVAGPGGDNNCTP